MTTKQSTSFFASLRKKPSQAPSRQVIFGQAIGILMVDNPFLRIPGDIGNATTYPFPVRIKTVEGIQVQDIVCEKPDTSVCQRFIEEAKTLEAEGVRAITAGCGYFSYFQDEIAEVVNVPVFTSSLIQVPLVAKMLGKNKQVGIICSNSKSLTTKHLRNAGIGESLSVPIAGFEEHWATVLQAEEPAERLNRFEKTLPKVAKDLISQNPKIGALVLECTNFPPGAAAVQEATGLPVFDIVTLTYMIHDVVVRKRYDGYM
jgi:Asp/Glu/hydantoin racemase